MLSLVRAKSWQIWAMTAGGRELTGKNMAKKLEYTPNSKIKAALRKLWLQSRERNKRLKLDDYSCQNCGAKQSRAKGKEVFVEVHHKDSMIENWSEMYRVIREFLLVEPEKLETLCKKCHSGEHK